MGKYLSQLDRHRSGWKQQSGPRATYFVFPLHQDVAMICVSREMFTVGVATIFMYFLCQSCVLMRPTYDTGHCLVWWPGASLGGQAPRWYPRFTLGDLFVTTLRVKWPGASFGGQAPRWYPRFCWAVPKTKKKKKRIPKE